MGRQGYTKRWRKRWEKGYHRDLLLWVLMDYFIDHANFESGEKFLGDAGLVKLKRGDCLFGTLSLAEFFGVGREQIRSRLRTLKTLAFLTTIKTTNRYSIATVCNYDKYNPSYSTNQPAPNQHISHLFEKITKIQPADQPAEIENINNKLRGLGITNFVVQPANQPVPNQQPTNSQPHRRKLKNDNEVKKEQENIQKKKCPHKAIVELYHKLLPELPIVQTWPKVSMGYLQKIWVEDVKRQDLAQWEAFFIFIGKSDWLMGRNSSSDWRADLMWIVRPINFAKILNSAYHKDTGPKTSRLEAHNKQVMEDWIRE